MADRKISHFVFPKNCAKIRTYVRYVALKINASLDSFWKSMVVIHKGFRENPTKDNDDACEA